MRLVGSHEELMERATELGFDRVGTSPLAPPPAAGRFLEWLAAGRHAGLDWLSGNADRITDPRTVLPEGRLVLSVALDHGRPAFGLADGTRIARYAAGRDYHNVVGKRLKRLARALSADGTAGRTRAIVDAGPLLERSHAAAAGIGFESKAANLLDRRQGPWSFLGELLLETDIDPEPATALGSCGTCTACIDACPTAAIKEPGVVDARDCISYHTIESREPAPDALRERFGEWLFGCDICSEVCPFGQRADDRSERFGTHAALTEASALELVRPLPLPEFKERLRGSPVQRPGPEGLARNAAVVLGNRPREGSAAALEAALEQPSALVREAAGWALSAGHADDAGSRAALERAAARESDGPTRAALGRHAARAADRGSSARG